MVLKVDAPLSAYVERSGDVCCCWYEVGLLTVLGNLFVDDVVQSFAMAGNAGWGHVVFVPKRSRR
jgi:hypothetical protein